MASREAWEVEELGLGFMEMLEASADARRFLNFGEQNNEVEEKKVMLRCPPPPPPPPPCSSAGKAASPPCYYSRMLCFGGEEDGFVVNGCSTWKPSGRSGGGGEASSTSTSSSSSNKNNSAIGKSKQGKEGRTNPHASAQKKQRKEVPASNTKGGATKVRKERLGERIAALQQLVSPFGKSDTASVLHEALGYIRFLHDQVQVLSSPYLHQLPSSSGPSQGGGAGRDLRSRGLCLVPIACTAQLAGSNGADLWSPSMGSCTGDGDTKH